MTKGKISTDTQDTILAMPIHLLFDFAAVHLIGERANDLDVRVNFTFSDFGDEWTMWVRNGVLNARKDHVDDAQLTVVGPKVVLAALLLQPSRANEIIEHAHLSTEGDLGVLDTFAWVMDTFKPDFKRNVAIAGELRYQACTSTLCYPPTSAPMRWELKVEPLDLRRSLGDIRHK